MNPYLEINNIPYIELEKYPRIITSLIHQLAGAEKTYGIQSGGAIAEAEVEQEVEQEEDTTNTSSPENEKTQDESALPDHEKPCPVTSLLDAQPAPWPDDSTPLSLPASQNGGATSTPTNGRLDRPPAIQNLVPHPRQPATRADGLPLRPATLRKRRLRDRRRCS
ncbi:hypothetical protein MKZ38_010782 [Zalerion maritima]|uniref:Uncharacterized protein n=1 Tax=Zalerion maritima TaxID=339359 RepID=A0AAD5RY33_9PEZI|nr:hypothetical protein MKZ38_010782 [Zalerion maritima]